MKILGKELGVREGQEKISPADQLDQAFEQLDMFPEKGADLLRDLDLPPGNEALMKVLGSRAILAESQPPDGALLRVRLYTPRTYQPTRLQGMNFDGLCALFFDEDQRQSTVAAKVLFEQVQKQPTYLGKAALGGYVIHELSQFRQGKQIFTPQVLEWKRQMKKQMRQLDEPNQVLRIVGDVKDFLQHNLAGVLAGDNPKKPDSPIWQPFKTKLDSYRETCKPKATLDYLSPIKTYREFVDSYILLKFAGCADSTFDLFLKKNLLKLFENDQELRQDRERLQLLRDCPTEEIYEQIGRFTVRLGAKTNSISDRNLEKVWRTIRLSVADYRLSFFPGQEQGYGVLN